MTAGGKRGTQLVFRIPSSAAQGRPSKTWKRAASPFLIIWTEYTYDAAGNVLTQSDRLGNTEAFSYDNLYRLVTREDADGGLTQYTYDQFGNRASLTDPLGNTTSWTYDNLDRVTQETNQLGLTRFFEYDAGGNLVERIDRRGWVTEYEYDALDRRVEERWLDGTTVARTLSWTYYAMSNLLSASGPSATYSYQYDNLGRTTSITHDLAGLAPDVVLEQAYDAIGRRTVLAAVIGGTADFRNEYQYDYLGRMTRLAQGPQTGGNSVAEKRIDLAYDAEDKGQWTGIARYADLAETQVVATSSYTYGREKVSGLFSSPNEEEYRGRNRRCRRPPAQIRT